MPKAATSKRPAERRKPGHFAPGIPNRESKKEIPSVKSPREWFLAEQEHRAQRAGKHSDLRLFDGQTALSWALRKGLPPPGKSHLAIRQPDHDPAYMLFEGPIRSQYGRGKVRLLRTGSVRVHNSSSDKINFASLGHKNPQEFSLFRTKKYGPDHWLLLNRTPTVKSRPDIRTDKLKIKESPVADIGHYMGREYALSSKIDGGQVTVNFGDKGVEVFSHAPNTKGELINHSYVTGSDKIKSPKSLAGTQVRAEVFAVKDKKVLPIQELGGLMNSAPDKALKRMEEEGITMHLAPLQVLKHKGKPTEAQSYKQHQAIIKTLMSRMPKNWRAPDVAYTRAAKEKMVKAIKEGTHPLTEEGTVAWPINGPGGQPRKLPFRKHGQVYIREVYAMKRGGKPVGLAGGFSYSLTPKGKIIGKVGTGFSMALRTEMWKEKGKMVGRKVIIESLGKYPSGAHRAASFISFHL
jgi:hypothetical protein